MRRRSRGTALLAVSLVGAAALGGCAQSRLEGGGGGGKTGATTLTMWTRANSADFDKRLVAAYNASHPTKVKLTVVPNDLFVTKFGAAAGSGQAPDLAAVDVIYMPKFDQTNQFTDITSRVDALPFRGALLQAHLRTSTWKNKVYAVPHNVDGSVLLYNEDLFAKAGLDPARPPTTWNELYRDAQAITKLGNGTYGYYFGGNCPGCNAYTVLPMLWGSGADVVSTDGRSATVDTPQMRGLLDLYHRMWAQKLVPPSARTENGTTWQSTFLTGKIGMVGLGTFAIPPLKQQQRFRWGLTALPTQRGQQSTFVGGDVLGIPRGSKHQQAAWDFISWSLDRPAQVDVMARSGVLTARSDLTDNRYTQADPRVKYNNDLLAKGRTPYVLPYNSIFNDANGPWLAMLRKGFFDGDVSGAVSSGQAAVAKTLARG